MLRAGTNAWTDVDHTAYTLTTAGSDGFLALLPVYVDHILFPTLTASGFVTEVHHITDSGNEYGRDCLLTSVYVPLLVFPLLPSSTSHAPCPFRWFSHTDYAICNCIIIVANAASFFLLLSHLQSRAMTKFQP